MPVQNLNFQGINRAVSDFASAGACEELINLRPTTMGLVPVKPFTVKMNGVSYDKIYEHKAGDATNYIAVELVSGSLSFSILNSNGTVVTSLCDPIDVSSYANFSINDVHYAAAGNILMFSIVDKEDKFYQNIAFLWNGTEYTVTEANIPTVTMAVALSSLISSNFTFETTSYTAATDSGQVSNIISAGLNAIQEENPDYCFGAILIALAFKTNDGNTFWTDQWRVYNPIKPLKDADDLVTSSNCTAAQRTAFQSFFDAHPEGGFSIGIRSTSQSKATVQMRAQKLTLTLSLGSGTWDEDTSIIKSVEVYASKPVLCADISSGSIDTKSWTDSYTFIQTLAPLVPYSDIDLDNQLLYLQKSIPMTELLQGSTSFDLSFGGSVQTTNKTLEVDAGAVLRFGNVLSYNARFHYFDSALKTMIQMPFFSVENNSSSDIKYIFVVYNDGTKDNTLYVGTKNIPGSDDQIIVASSLKIKSVIVYHRSVLVSITYPMTESQRYNYTIYKGDTPTLKYLDQDNIYEDIIEDTGITSEYDTLEPSAINVTEQYNPFVFRVDHSYLAPGKVVDIQPQMVAVADVSYGDYPLNVFTNRGLYALLQGNGAVLYGAFRPVSNLVMIAKCKSVPTESGTFFIAAGALWLISGSKAVLISDALSLGPHTYIRNNTAGYGQICGSADGYNVSSCVSQVIFEDYVKDATLSYNRYRDELIISNPNYAYSYVLSLKYRQWFKINLKLSQDTIAGDLALSLQTITGKSEVIVGIESHLIMNYADTLTLTIVYNSTQYSVTIPITPEIGGYEIDIPSTLKAAWMEQYANTELAGLTFEASSKRKFAKKYLSITVDFSQTAFTNASLFSGTLRSLLGTSSFSTAAISFSNYNKVYNFADEIENTSVLAHLQSRPFSFGFQYAHVHRIVSMVRSLLGSSDKLIVALYGSDDLQNWTLITYAKRSNVTISQIRTAPAGRSWRYYTITLGGTVPTDTDLGPIMVDYKPVIRRIG